MVICLLQISSRSRKLIGIFDGILFFTLIFFESLLVLLKCDKIREFQSNGVLDYLWQNETFFVCSMAIVCFLLLFSVFLLIFVFDVAVSQESSTFRVDLRNYSSSIYLIIVSLILCVLSFALSIRISTEFDHKMTKLLMTSYLNYGTSVESRRMADRIHMEYSCCGVNSIEDFVDLAEVDKKLPPQTKLWSCNEWAYCGVPLSCCKTTSCSQKVALLVKGWDPTEIAEKWFHQKGCIHQMDNSALLLFSEQLISHALMILILGFHVGGIFLHQILVTASATLNGARLEYHESSYAWLVDIGQPDPRGLCMMLNPELQASDFDVVSESTKRSSDSSKNENQEPGDPAEPREPGDSQNPLDNGSEHPAADGADLLILGSESNTNIGTHTETRIDGTTDSTKPTDITDDILKNKLTASSSDDNQKVTASSSNEHLPGNHLNLKLPETIPQKAGKNEKVAKVEKGKKAVNEKKSKETKKPAQKTVQKPKPNPKPSPKKKAPPKKSKSTESKKGKNKPNAKKSNAPAKKSTAKPKKK